MQISVVIPVFNDAQALPELMQRLFSVMDMAGLGVELILIDDGSENDVWSEMGRLKLSFPERNILLFQLAKNEGQHRATLFGIMHCSHDVIITMDSDLQHPPEEIPRLVGALIAGNFDLIYGAASLGHSFMRRIAGYIFFKMSSFSIKDAVRGSAFRAMTRETANRLMEKSGASFIFIDAILRTMNLSVTSVEVEHHIRKYGRSSYSGGSVLLMAIRAWWFYIFSKIHQKR